MEDIIRYQNRKMYSRTQSKHITLSEIQALVQEGKEVRVVSHLGEDITFQTLRKIMYMPIPESQVTEELKNAMLGIVRDLKIN